MLNFDNADFGIHDPVEMEYGASALSNQIKGNHYKTLAIQPVEYIHANGIGFCEGSAIKYLSRWRAKGGLDDLQKARHFIDMLIELEEKQLPLMQRAEMDD